MAELFASGTIIDLVLAGVLVEALALHLLFARRQLGPGLARVAANLAAGAALMVAVRAALVDADWQLVALALVAALVAHVVDLAGRWSELPAGVPPRPRGEPR